ncbi:TadE/TadG family type IV pilus assembly protein [Litorimonas sp. WD9-15]|uniref:TadE/TadG family type IV pilus assembly protein n=1 Tax=Litorimonas sp. WD9-15 TaxID=3418716 RepID=UPI003D00EA4C
MTYILPRTAKFLAKRLRRNEEGAAAIEFAFVAPVMIMMYFGLAEIATAIDADRRVSHGTNVAGDLATHTSEMTVTDVEETLSAAIRIMGVADARKVTIDMRSFIKDTNGNITSEGIVQMNPSANNLPSFNAATLDEKILSENSGIVVTRVAYTYSPLKLRFFDTDITLSETFMLKPRRSNSVVIGKDSGKDISCSASGYATVTCTGSTSSS